MQLSKFLIHVKSSLWFVPVLCVLAGVLLSLGTIALDRYFDYEAAPGALAVGPDAAVVILTTIAGSMVSLAALVLTITMVVVQLAMGQVLAADSATHPARQPEPARNRALRRDVCALNPRRPRGRSTTATARDRCLESRC